MFTEKNGKKYEITEKKNGWAVVWERGSVKAEFIIPKEICKTDNDVREYILSQSMF